MPSILDKEWNEAVEASAKEAEGQALALRSMNGESKAWVWQAAQSVIELAERIRRLKRTDSSLNTDET